MTPKKGGAEDIKEFRPKDLGLCLEKLFQHFRMPFRYKQIPNVFFIGKQIPDIVLISMKLLILDPSIPYRDWYVYQNLINKYIYIYVHFLTEIWQDGLGGSNSAFPLSDYQFW